MEKKIKVGVIGVGSIAEMHIAGYKADPRVELAAFCDINEERLKEKGERHGVTRLYTDVKDMVAKEKLDAVSVCTWNAATPLVRLRRWRRVSMCCAKSPWP